MHLFHALPIEVHSAAPDRLEADLLAVPVFDGDDLSELPGLDAASGGEIARLLASGELSSPFESAVVPLVSGGYTARRALLVYAGSRAGWAADAARKFGAVAAATARQRRAPRLVVRLRVDPQRSSPAHEPLRLAQAVCEGLVLPQLDIGVFKTEGPRAIPLEALSLNVPADMPAEAAREAAERGRLLGEATNQARELANQPANVMTPAAMASAAETLASGTGLRLDVLDEPRLIQEGMGLLLGVARGSAEPPRLIVLEHEPAGAAPMACLGLVGKGVTFDTGGISIKPAEAMDRMKTDMSGGAAVICAMRALSRLGVPLRVIGIVPCTENMPGGRAFKPGDVLRGASGKSVEIVNTDAEGRLVLGDGLWYARKLGATHLIDVATLTGACGVALGKHMSGLFATPDSWGADVRRAGDLAGDKLWPMPLADEYLEQLKSDVADLINSGGRMGGAVTAAMFLRQFVGDVPWAHLDIAATAWIDEPKPWQARGASGVGVRTLVEVASILAMSAVGTAAATAADGTIRA